MSGVESTGFVTKTTAEILEEMSEDVKGELGAETNTEADSAMGVVLGIVADKLGELWEVAQAIYSSRDPDAATGAAQDAVCAITGTVREAATKSQVTVTVTCTGVVSVAAGNFIGSVDGNPDARFVNAEAIVAGGAGDVYVLFEAEDTGPTVANSGTLTVIETPTANISAITNASDATVGSDTETDAELRPRREDELDGIGAGTLDTVRARLSEVDGVTASEVYENTGDTTDSDGVPGHSMWAIVWGSPMPAANDVAQGLWDAKPGGIYMHGSSSGSAEDAEGNGQTVKYDEATEVEIHIAITVTTDSDLYPPDGDAQIKAAIIAARSEFVEEQDGNGIGLDVYSQHLKAAAFDVDGVLDVTAWTIDTVDPPVLSANIAIDKDEYAVFDTGNIDVTS